MTLPARLSPLATPGAMPPLTLAERAALQENDADNATRLLSEYGRDLLFVVNRGWAVWDGTRYAFTAGDLAAFGVAARLRDLVEAEARYLYDHATVEDYEAQEFLMGKGAAACFKDPDPLESARQLLRAKKSGNRLKHAKACGNVERINKALDYARHLSSATIDKLDADPLAFVCANGEIDLASAARWDAEPGTDHPAIRAGFLREIRRENLPTRASPVAYDPRATCPKWEDFMDLAMPRYEDRAALQRCLGYLMSGRNPEAACMVMRGGGGNGKTTILNAINRLFGTLDGYAEGCDIDLFMVTPGKATGGHDADMMDLIGGRVYIGTEPAPTDTFSMKKIKSLTGGDLKKSRGAYQPQGVKWVPRGVPLLSCNKTPRIADDDPGTRRRLVFIPLETDFKALDPALRKGEAQVEAEIGAELPGILNWFLDGWRDYSRRGGLDLPERWRDLRDTLMEDADPVGQFLRECTVEDPAGRVRRSDFNAVYKAWAEDEGGANWSGRAVNSAMKEKGFSTLRINGNEHWPGFWWNPDKAAFVERVTGSPPALPPPQPPPDPF